jgi:hypothetical protein
MDTGVWIPKDDSVRLLAFVLTQLDLKSLYEAYDAYRKKRRREEAAREREAAERGAGELAGGDETEHTATQPDRRGRGKKKEGRPPCGNRQYCVSCATGTWRGSNMLSSGLREANEKAAKGNTKKKRRYEYRANVNHAAGMLKDQLVGILIADDPFVRKYL